MFFGYEEDVPDGIMVGCQGQRFGGNGDVIHVYPDDSASCFVFQDGGVVNVIHHCLEGGRRVSETEEHDLRLKQSPVGGECGLPLIPFLDTYVIIAPSNVKFGEVSGISKPAYEVG